MFPVYKIVHKGVELAICQAPLGGAAATQIMEQLIAGGVKKVIATGCCGALVADNEGDFFSLHQHYDRKEHRIIICLLPAKLNLIKLQ